MNEKDHIEQRINAYFNRQMTTVEVEQFERDLLTNAELKGQFDFSKEVFDAIQDKEASQFEMNLADVMRESKVSVSKDHNNPRRRILYMVAVAASLIILFGLWQTVLKPQTTQQLFAQNYSTYIHSTSRGDSTADWGKIYAMYSDGRYTEFINEVEDDIGNQRTQDFFLAMAYMETKQWQKAQSLLKELSDVQHPQFTDASIWYLALTHIQSNNVEEAKKQLQRLSTYKGVYARKSKKLLRQLD